MFYRELRKAHDQVLVQLSWSLQFYISRICAVYIIYTHSVNYPKYITHIFPEYKTAYDFSKKKPQQTNPPYHCPGGLYAPTGRNNLIQSLFLHS